MECSFILRPMKNILDFANDYVSTLATVVLKHNYRSNQHILDISKALINNNNERLTKQLSLDKNLQSSHARFNELVVKPVIREYENADQRKKINFFFIFSFFLYLS